MPRYCPECKMVLMNPHKCNDCGWIDTSKVKHRNKPDYRCAFETMGQRCTRAGTMSTTTHSGGSDGKTFEAKWYCCLPHMEHDTSKPPTNKPAKDWRDELVDKHIAAKGLQGYEPKTLEEKREAMQFIKQALGSMAAPRQHNVNFEEERERQLAEIRRLEQEFYAD